ncbi:cytochrome P450- family 7- subfamily B (oxysterol 7-alpha-hydroxylase) [Apiospora arundinis]
MPPSYPIKQLGFSDDRRRNGYESYRHLDRDRDPDRGIGDRSSLSRRDTDPRNYQHDRDRSRDKERNRPKPTENLELQLNTSIPTVQPVLEQVGRWEDIVRKRTIISVERDRKEREIEERKRTMENMADNRNDNSSILEYLQRLRDYDKKEWEDINRRFRSLDEQYNEYLESIATAIHYTSQMSPDTPNAQAIGSSIFSAFGKEMEVKFDAKVAALEKKMEHSFAGKVAALEKNMEERLVTRTAGLEKRLTLAQKEIKVLDSARIEAEEKIKELQSGRDEALSTIQEVGQKTVASTAELLSSHVALEAQIRQLQSSDKQLRAEITALEDSVSKVSRKATQHEADVNSMTAATRTAISTKASSSNLENAKDKYSTDLAELKKQVKKHKDQLDALNSTKPPYFPIDTREKLQALISEVETVTQIRHDLNAVLQSTGKLERRLGGLDTYMVMEMLDVWEGSRIASEFPKHNSDIEHLQNEVKKLQRQGDRLVQEPTIPVPDDSLRKEITSLQHGDRKKREEIDQLRNTMKGNMNKLVGHVQALLRTQMEETAKRLDNLDGRMKQVESRNDLCSNEQDSLAWNQAQAQNHTSSITYDQFDTRIKAVEDGLPLLVAEHVGKEVTEPFNTRLEAFRHELVDQTSRLERLSLEVGVVSTQLSNVWTKPLWDQICRLADQNYTAYGPKIEAQRIKLAQVEEKVAILVDKIAPIGPKRSGSSMRTPLPGSAPKRQRLDYGSQVLSGSSGDYGRGN